MNEGTKVNVYTDTRCSAPRICDRCARDASRLASCGCYARRDPTAWVGAGVVVWEAVDHGPLAGDHRIVVVDATGRTLAVEDDAGGFTGDNGYVTVTAA